MCSLHHLFAFPFLSSWMLLPYMPLLMTGAATFFQNKINANLTWKICLLQFLVKNLLHLIHHITPSYSGNGYLLNSKVCSYCCILECQNMGVFNLGGRFSSCGSKNSSEPEWGPRDFWVSMRKMLQPHSGCPGVFEPRSWMIIFWQSRHNPSARLQQTSM